MKVRQDVEYCKKCIYSEKLGDGELCCMYVALAEKPRPNKAGFGCKVRKNGKLVRGSRRVR